MTNLLFINAIFLLLFYHNLSSYFDFIHSFSNNLSLMSHYFNFVIALYFSFQITIILISNSHQFILLKLNLNFEFNFQQIKIFLEKVFNYLLFTGVLLAFTNSLLLVNLFKIDTHFS